MALVCFSHGKDSGPNATKISALREVANSQGHNTISVDYRGMPEPEPRIKKLISSAGDTSQPLILVGSSMGGYVSLHACHSLTPIGLFLIAPAVYMPGYESIYIPPKECHTEIYHGWNDDIVPVDNVIRFAGENQLELSLLKDDHRLSLSLPLLLKRFAYFLERCVHPELA